MQLEKVHAYSSRRALRTLSQLSRSIARAESRDELLELTGGCLRDLGFRSYLAELEGDRIRLLADSIETESIARVETILGQPLTSLHLRTSAIPCVHAAATRRAPATSPDLSTSFMSLVPHLSAAERAALRREIGDGPFTAVPVERGDDLLGVLVTWRTDQVSIDSLPFLQVVAAQLGPAWRRLGGGVVPEPVSADVPGTMPDLIRGLIESGGIRPAMQPIIRLLDGVTLGYESLCRINPGAGPQVPSALFDAAGGALEKDLDEACIRAGLEGSVHTMPATLFLNVMLSTLSQPNAAVRLAQFAEAAGVLPEHIVLEVSERVPVPNVARLRRVVADLRARGFRIAIDDAGAGHASMLVIAEVRPDFIKIDRDLIRGVHSSDSRRALVVSMLSFGTHIDARIIAEGIETESDLRCLMDLGVQFGQGNVLCEPVILGEPAVQGATLVQPAWFAGRRVECFPASVEPAAPSHEAPQRRPHPALPVPESLPHALSRAALALQAEHDPQRILAAIAEQLQRVVPVDDLSIYEADHNHHRFVAAFATGRQAAEIMADVFSLSVGVNGWAFALGTPQNLGNAGAHPAAAAVPNTPFEHESLLLIPLRAGDHKLGMLNCRRMGLNRFTDEDLETATLFGHTAAMAWHNAQLYQELARRATTDGLTGLYNSRWLREAGELELADSRRRGMPLSVVLVDLDHFKSINDSGGHAAGDAVLQRVATELRRITRAGDAAVRLGGEEFILVLRDAESSGAERVAGDLRRALRDVPIPAACTGIDHVTASIGIASFPEQGSRLEDLVRAADIAMYQAKRGGRDQVKLSVISSTPSVQEAIA
ncbi:MAG: diguanylate cyclase [Candidatus Dormiibacterota bacterium]